VVSHISRKTSEMWGTRPFFKERRIKFIGATKVHRKWGIWGTRRFAAGMI
jgi:hypothetical protein